MSTNHPKQYIVEQDSQSQESVATRYLVEESLSRERLLAQLGLSEFCWMILELRLGKLLPDISGEIDILAGPLRWLDPAAFAHAVESEPINLPLNSHPSWAVRLAMSKIAISGGIAWPPPVDDLGGIEVKRAYRNKNGELRAKKGVKFAMCISSSNEIYSTCAWTALFSWTSSLTILPPGLAAMHG